MDRRIDVTPGFCILWAVLLLTLPLRLLLAAAAAALVHELGHLIALRGMDGKVLGLTVGAGGIVLETLPMSPGRELVCALAGPLGSLLLLLLRRQFPVLALWGLVQGCFNLLPLYPLDGGRAVACILQMAGRAHWLKAIEMLTLAGLLAAALCCGPGWGPLAVWGMLAARKIPCKDHRFGVQ